MVDVIADPTTTISGVAAALTTAELQRYDAVVTTVGDVDAFSPSLNAISDEEAEGVDSVRTTVLPDAPHDPRFARHPS